jgi:hypothetical protein
MTGPMRPQRDPLLDAADALEAGRLTHEQLRSLWGAPDSPQQQAAHREDIDLGPLRAAGLGAARGASFGLGDLAQRLTLNPTEQATVHATTGEHPHATFAGTMAGAALPFVLSGGQEAAFLPQALAGGAKTLPALGAVGTRTAIGAAQGAGLTSGDLPTRAVGAALGAGTAAAAPYLARGAGAVATRLPIVGGLARRVGGMRFGAPAAEAASAEEAPMTELQPVNRPGPLVHPDVAQATRDYEAGKITGEDLRTAYDVAAGRSLPPEAPATTPPKVQNPLDALRSVPDASLSPTPPLEQSAAAPGVTEGRAASAMQSALGKEPTVAKSYLELQQLLRKGIPRDQIKVDYWTRGGAAEQSIPPTRAPSPPTPNPAMTEASRPLAEALGQVPKAGSASAVAGAMQSPAYQGASRLAHHALVQGWGPFQGMSEPEATAVLQKMILDRVQAGREIPPITSIKKFLDRLAGS